MSDDHGTCPHCSADLNGGLIWETFRDRGEAEADRIAAQYGATRTSGRWGLAIGIYSQERDRTVSWGCPFCEKEWAA